MIVAVSITIATMHVDISRGVKKMPLKKCVAIVKLYTDSVDGWPSSGFRYFCTDLPAGTSCRWYRMCKSHICGEDGLCVGEDVEDSLVD